MYRLICVLILSISALLTISTHAAETAETASDGNAATTRYDADTSGRQLYVKHLCYECHRPVEHHIGPSLQAISDRYANEKDRASLVIRLSSKIIEGGYGNWGVLPMNSNPGVSPAEALELSEWILGSSSAN
jgi:cytochrome c